MHDRCLATESNNLAHKVYKVEWICNVIHLEKVLWYLFLKCLCSCVHIRMKIKSIVLDVIVYCVYYGDVVMIEDAKLT